MIKNISKRSHVAIVPPKFVKPEARVVGGIAQIEQKIVVHVAQLVMDYQQSDNQRYPAKCSHAILEGDCGLKPWAKKIYEMDGKTFCLAPEAEVIGFRVDYDTVPTPTPVPRLTTKEQA